METRRTVKKKWDDTLNAYLDGVNALFAFYHSKKKKIDIGQQDFILKTTFIIFAISIVVFLSSCQRAYGQRLPETLLSELAVVAGKNRPFPKRLGKKKLEQLYTKRDHIIITEKENGSRTGSIWSDSIRPQTLLTQYTPSHPGDVLTVNIPDELQPKANANNQNAPTEQIKFIKFEVVALEPGGDIYLRAVKTYKDPNGMERSILILAKAPRRSIRNSEISATELTSIAVNETNNGENSSYESFSWDPNVTKKLEAYAPDMQSISQAMEAERSDLSVRKKALDDRKKSLDDAQQRLKKDRERLNSEKAQAHALLKAGQTGLADPKTAAAKTKGTAAKSTAPTTPKKEEKKP